MYLHPLHLDWSPWEMQYLEQYRGVLLELHEESGEGCMHLVVLRHGQKLAALIYM